MCGPVKESLVDLLARILTAPQCEREQLEKQPVCSRSATAERPEIVIANGINTDPSKVSLIKNANLLIGRCIPTKIYIP